MSFFLIQTSQSLHLLCPSMDFLVLCSSTWDIAEDTLPGSHQACEAVLCLERLLAISKIFEKHAILKSI
jgi:hypothetical protein